MKPPLPITHLPRPYRVHPLTRISLFGGSALLMIGLIFAALWHAFN